MHEWHVRTERLAYGAKPGDVLLGVASEVILHRREAELDRTQWGTQHATRAWTDVGRIANTWPRAEFMEWVGKRRGA